MSRRNLILLILVLFIIIMGFFGFLFSTRTTLPRAGDTTGLSFLSKFNPFNSTAPAVDNPITPTTPDTTVDITPAEETQTPDAVLKKISSMPIAGYAVFQREILKPIPEAGPLVAPVEIAPTPTKKAVVKKIKAPETIFVPMVRYVSRADGNIYQTFLDTITEKRFSSTVIPKIYEAIFGDNGQIVIMRSLNTNEQTIESFVGNLPKNILGVEDASNNEIKGTFLPDGVTDLSLSTDTSKIFYLFNVGENTVGINYDLANNKKTQIFSSAFNEWLTSYPNTKSITLTTKPSSNVPGYMYNLDTATKNFNKTIGDINGLTTLPSPDGKMVLYGDSSLSLYLYNIQTRATTTLGIKTLPEKCVWDTSNTTIYCAVPKETQSSNYPDSWYQGETSFNDQIWKLDMSTLNATLLANPSTIGKGEEVDAIKLNLDQNQTYLMFVNKKDSYLWELKLK
jgi:hypothetical protein